MTHPSFDSCGCPESTGLSRRALLRAGGTATALGLTGLGGVTSSAFGADADTAVVTAQRATTPGPAKRVLVVLSMRGAVDGLSLIVPHSDPAYAAARRVTAIPKTSLLAANDTLGLHPGLQPLMGLWTSGRMAAIPAVGLPTPNRSHFAAMEAVEDSDPGTPQRIGWLNRLIGRDTPTADVPHTSPLLGVSIGAESTQTQLAGPSPTLAVRNADRVDLAAADTWDTAKRRPVALRTMWDDDRGPLGTAARAALDAHAAWQPVRDTPVTRDAYPHGIFGDALASVARLIKADVGTEVITVDHGNWDTHVGAGTLEWGATRSLADTFARGVAALFADLDTDPALAAKVTVVTISEFGRRVQENASYGTDHGWGTASFVFGAGVDGGYKGTMPKLENTLDADVPVTTDYRSLLSEVTTTCFDVSSAKVFPGFAPQTVGVMRD